jgi:GTPase SAR1 family protein
MRQNLRKLRANALSACFVKTQRVAKAFTRIDELLRDGWEETFCRSLLLFGNSRAGKTHIVTNYIRLREEEAANPDDRLRIVLVEVPSGCTLKSFAEELLTALGDADPAYGSLTEKSRRVAYLIETQALDLIVIDEVQRLIDADTDKVKRDVANWITALLNRRLCPLLLVGERKAERVFADNMHLAGRTLGEIVLDPYDWSVKEDQDEFRGVLHMLDKALGMEVLAGLGQMDTAIRVYAYSQGLLGQAATLVERGRAIALRAGRPQITHDLLAEAVDELRIGGERRKVNPFRVVSIDKVEPATSSVDRDLTPRRSYRRKGGGHLLVLGGQS